MVAQFDVDSYLASQPAPQPFDLDSYVEQNTQGEGRSLDEEALRKGEFAARGFTDSVLGTVGAVPDLVAVGMRGARQPGRSDFNQGRDVMIRRMESRRATARAVCPAVVFVAVVFVAVVLVFRTGSAHAQNRIAACAQRDAIVKRLDERYGEHRNNMMLDAQGNLVELFSNLDTGSWTLTVTVPGGPTCTLSSGRDFVQEARTGKLKGEGS